MGTESPECLLALSYEVADLFPYGHGGYVGVCSYAVRHYRGVRNTEAGYTVNLTVLVDHGHRVKFQPHLAFRWPRSKARCSISSAKSVFDR